MKDLLELAIGMEKDIKELPDSIRELIEGYKQYIKELKSQHQKELKYEDECYKLVSGRADRLDKENQKLNKDIKIKNKIINEDTQMLLDLRQELSDLRGFVKELQKDRDSYKVNWKLKEKKK